MYTYNMNTKTDILARDLMVGTRVVLGLNIRTVATRAYVRGNDFMEFSFAEVPNRFFTVSVWETFIPADDTLPLF